MAGLAVIFLCRLMFKSGGLAFSRTFTWAFGLIVMLAGFSSFYSDKPDWALCEVSLALACCAISCSVAEFRRGDGVFLDGGLITFIFAICLIKTLQFLISTLAGFVTSNGTLDLALLVEGFSNRRFYGQFQTFTLPLLAVPLLLPGLRRSTKAWVLALLGIWWLIAIVGGTRGTWLGMAVAGAVMLACGPQGVRWLRWQVIAAFAGLVLYWVLFSVLADFLGIELVNSASGRLTTTLSARDVLWSQAWEMIRAKPLLGFGPMHFANIHNPIAAHPHQAILQWASEWGLPSTILVGWLVLRGVWAVFRHIRTKSASSERVDLLRICLFASLVGALTQSMVDGVIVMPYSQLWLSIVVGWLMGIHEWPIGRPSFGLWRRQLWGTAMALAIGFLGYVAIRDFPNLEARNEQFGRDFGGNYQPRFWQQGVIATKPQ
ncbi:O-antigen ligase family protein [Pseudomonas sp. NPDC088444]|uniref:O-antigen ligase family protein n=1 Tax=Pseudomonas sp. NPDC088444 TaxID=3364456 RepID=UPI00384DF63D